MLEDKHLLIRTATPRDVQNICAIYETQRDAPGSCDYKSEDFRKLIRDVMRCSIYIAESGEVALGFVIVFDMVMWGYVDLLVVRKDVRRLKLGTRLMQHVEHNAPKRWRLLEIFHVDDDSYDKFTQSINFTGKDAGLWKCKRLNHV